MSLVPADLHGRRLLLGILTCALLLRVGAACGLQYLLDHRWHRPFLIEGDADGYWRLAQAIANGDDYAVYTPPRYVLRMPGFPLLLAVSISLFGPSLLAARLYLALLGTVACWLVYLLGKQLSGERTGIIACGLSAISPVYIVFGVEILSETAFAATLVLGLIAGERLFRLLDESRGFSGRMIGQSLLTGGAIAAGVYMRPSWILAAPIAAVLLTALSARRGPAAGAGMLIVAGMVACLLPWGMRNQLVTGHFTLTTFWMGPSLYDGLNPQATGDSDMTFYDTDRLMERMSEYEVDQYYRRAAWEYAQQHPGRVLELAGEKLRRYWMPWPNAPQFSSPLAKLAVGSFFVPVAILAIWGVLCVLHGRCAGAPAYADRGEDSPIRRRRGAEIWSVAILAGPILYFSAIHLVFVSSLRYRLPAEYPLLVLSAIGLQDAWRRLRH